MKTFKCIDCGNIFEADDTTEICCVCSSDNITPVKKILPITKGIFVGLLGIPLGLGAGLGIDAIINSVEKDATKVEEYISSETITSQETVNPQNPVEEITNPVEDIAMIPGADFDKPEIIGIKDHSLSYVNGGFSFEVEVKTKSKNPSLKYEIWNDSKGYRYPSTDGRFNGVKPTDDGYYNIRVTNTRDYSYDEDFLKGLSIADQIKPLSKDEIQRIFDNPAESLKNVYHRIAPSCDIDYIGLNEEDIKVFETFDIQDLIQELNASTISSLTVVGEPKHDKHNHLIWFKVKVEY